MRSPERKVATIADVAYGGRGVARTEEGVVFVPGVLPGERVALEVVRSHSSYHEGRLLEVLEAGSGRIPPACPLACKAQPRAIDRTAVCPGCSYLHAAYETELSIKQRQFRDLVERTAGLDPSCIAPPQPAPRPLAYRNKMSLHAHIEAGEQRLGYRLEDNVTVVDVPVCPLAVDPINAQLGAVRDQPGFFRTLRAGMAVTFRHTPHDGVVWWRGQAGARTSWLVEDTDLGPLSVPRDSFFQVNPTAAAGLVRRFMDSVAAHPTPRLVDLFCGVGLFALAAARAGIPEVHGADSDPAAVAAAVYNLRRHGLENARLLADDALKALGRLVPPDRAAETAVCVDPPRSGLGRALVQALLAVRPVRIWYVACGPDTLARDLAWLCAGGYRVAETGVIDLFPRTAHFETFTRLERADA